MDRLVIFKRENIVAMANAIRNKTGKNKQLTIGEMIEDINSMSSNGTDTSDATATSSDILNGKTAYIDGGKVTGTFTIDEEITAQDNIISQIQMALSEKSSNNLDTSDATATAEDIANGKTAYVNGEKITGIHECASGTSVDTCTLNCTHNIMNAPSIIVTVLNNGVVETIDVMIPLYTDKTIENVVCGSCAVISPNAFSDLLDTATYVDGEEYIPDSDYHCMFTVPNKKDGIVEVVVDSLSAQ